MHDGPFLTIDWDFFFPNPLRILESEPREAMLYDWGASEEWPSSRLDFLWGLRANGLVKLNHALPKLSGEERAFASRFRFARGAKLWVAESHAQMAQPPVAALLPSEIWSFDAHHDAGYSLLGVRKMLDGKAPWSCDAWAAYWATVGVATHVRYPRWATGSFSAETMEGAPTVSHVLVSRAFDVPGTPLPAFTGCLIVRSGAWVPPWHDAAFTKLVRSMERAMRTEAEVAGPVDPRVKRRQVVLPELFGPEHEALWEEALCLS